MKKREGFVSNSSSTSFVVHWRMRVMGEKTNIKEALSRLYDAYIYDIEKGDFNWDENEWSKKAFKEKFETIIENTKQVESGSFVTSAWTSMLNSYDDLGEVIQSLVFALVANENFEIIDSKLDCDH